MASVVKYSSLFQGILCQLPNDQEVNICLWICYKASDPNYGNERSAETWIWSLM